MAFVKHLKEYCLNAEDQMMVTFFCHRLVNRDDDDIRFSQIEDLFNNQSDFNRAKTELRSGEHKVQWKKVIEHRCVDGIADVTRYKLTESGKRTLLAEMKINEAEEKFADMLEPAS